jgi:PAP2 superfamily
VFPRSAAAAAAAYAALAALVAAGELTAIDRWAIAHAMPAAHLTAGKPTLAGALVPLWGLSWSSAGRIVTNVVTLPAAFLVATALVAAACVRLRGRAAVVLAAAFVAGNATEVLTKSTLTRPALYRLGVHLAGFDASYPSGHTLRTVLIAAAVGAAWPHLRRWLALWAACSVAMIELGGLHVPSDIVGGLLLAGGLLAATWPWRPGAPWTTPRPSGASRPSPRDR